MTSGFAAELARLGPEAPPRTFSPWQARRYCARLTAGHYENFSVASLLLPRRLVSHFEAVYSFCRWADDLGDETGGGARALGLLRWWRQELDRLYDGAPRHPVMVALRPTVARFGLPKQPFLDLLWAFEQDQLVKTYATFDHLLGYCRGSADPVGRIVLRLCDCYDDSRAALSDAICTGLQLANFWQDVARDLDIGRIYLPKEDLDRFGVAEEALFARRATPAFLDLMRFQVERARGFFARGRPLVATMPADVRPDIDLFVRGGLAILDRIEAAGYDTLTQRPALSKWRKGALVLGALGRRLLADVAGGRYNGAASGPRRRAGAPSRPLPDRE